MIYEVILGRSLAPAAYGAYQAAIGLLVVLGVLAAIVQAATAYEVAKFGGLSSHWKARLVGAVAVVAAPPIILAMPAGTLFHLPPSALAVIGITAALWIGLGAARGVLQGNEHYIGLGSSFVAENGFRLWAVATLIRPFGMMGGLSGVTIASALALAGTAALAKPGWAVRDPLGGKEIARLAAGSIIGSWVPTAPLLALRPTWAEAPYAALTAVNLFAKGLTQIAVWFELTLYPRLVRAPAQAHTTWRFSITVAGLATLGTAFAASAVAPHLVHLVFANRYAAYVGWFELFFPAMVPISLFGLFVTRAMADQDSATILLLAVGGAAWSSLFLMFHTGFLAVLFDYAALALLLAATELRRHVAARRPAAS